MRRGLLLLVVAMVGACGGKKAGENSGANRVDRLEAEINVQRLYKGAVAYFVGNASFPVGKAGPNPIGAPWACAGGKVQKHKAPAFVHDSAIWDDLNFEINADGSDFLYSYEYEGDANGFTVTAQGDLDCDGTPATFKMTGKLNSGNVIGDEMVMENPND